MDEREQASGLPDLGPDVYARWRASELGAATERIERELILELAGDVMGRDVLDVGCGDGELALALADNGANVIGIDSSSAMIEAARIRARRHEMNITFEIARAEHLPFPAERFDVVAAVTILCFEQNAEAVFKEVSRVLRPGGLFVIGELGKWSTWALQRRVRALMGSKLWRYGRFRTARELSYLAKKAGLRVQTVRGAIFYPRISAAARLLAPLDSSLGRIGTFGAGFVALAAKKP